MPTWSSALLRLWMHYKSFKNGVKTKSLANMWELCNSGTKLSVKDGKEAMKDTSVLLDGFVNNQFLRVSKGTSKAVLVELVNQ